MSLGLLFKSLKPVWGEVIWPVCAESHSSLVKPFE